MKTIILELLKLSHEAKTEMSINRLEKLANLKSKEKPLLGVFFKDYLEGLKEGGLLCSNENKTIYTITEKGIGYLKKNNKFF